MKKSIVCLKWHCRNEIYSPPLRVLHTRLDECDRYYNLNTVVHLATPLKTCLLNLPLGRVSKRTKPSQVWNQKIIVVSSNQSSPNFPLFFLVIMGSDPVLSKSESWAYLCRRNGDAPNSVLEDMHTSSIFLLLHLCVVFRRINISSY